MSAGPPNVDLLLFVNWGGSNQVAEYDFSGASNVITGTNPPYFLPDFLNMFPKFGGVPATVQASIVSGQPAIAFANLPSSPFAVGMLITGTDIPDGTVLISGSGLNWTMSNNATATTANETVNAYNAPLVSTFALQAYLILANACLMQARWQEMWTTAMAWFIAHFATLYLMSDSVSNPAMGQAAQMGVSRGIQISRSVGDVSVGYQALAGLDDWSGWNLTIYGQQLASFAKIVGAGPMYLY